MVNRLTLAVAGSGKTRGLVEHCASLPSHRRVAVITFTQANQAVLRTRLAAVAGGHAGIEVMGWFAFLSRHFARPFVPFMFPGRRILGFSFDGRPHRFAKGSARFLDSESRVYACELGRLAHELIEASNGSLIRRLECIYDEIVIDEIQDFSAHDWDILDVLLGSSIDVTMVGDFRQAVLVTNPRSSKHKRYAYAGAIEWFRERAETGLVEISYSSITYRCRPEIAAFGDTIFGPEWELPRTESRNYLETGHDGVFLVHPDNVEVYVEQFSPLCLRNASSSGKKYDLDYVNFRVSKGTEHQRVLIVPTAAIEKFLHAGVALEPGPAAAFYVASTRAFQSVAIVVAKADNCGLPWWEPSAKVVADKEKTAFQWIRIEGRKV